MDINRLRYFSVLCRSSSMREASEHLHISQPALSKAMKLLEQELGEKLLTPSGRGILITDKGRVIAQKAKAILEELDKITVDETPAGNRLIRIGSFEVFTTYFMGDVINKSLKDYKISLRELLPGRLEEQIAQGNVDIGITYLPVPHPQLDFIKVNDIEMGIYSSKSHFKNFEFHNYPFVTPVTPVEGLPHKAKGLDGWPDDKLPRNIVYQVDLMETALELCRRGLAVAYLPRFVVDLHNSQVKTDFILHSLKTPKKFKQKKQSVYLIKRKSDIEHPSFKKIATELRNL